MQFRRLVRGRPTRWFGTEPFYALRKAICFSLEGLSFGPYPHFIRLLKGWCSRFQPIDLLSGIAGRFWLCVSKIRFGVDAGNGRVIVWRNGKPDRGVDIAPDYRGFPMGPCASIPHQGSGRLVQAGLRATSARHGHSGSTDRNPIAVAKHICREAHWLDPRGMPGPHDRIRRNAPAPKRRRVCCPLQ